VLNSETSYEPFICKDDIITIGLCDVPARRYIFNWRFSINNLSSTEALPTVNPFRTTSHYLDICNEDGLLLREELWILYVCQGSRGVKVSRVSRKCFFMTAIPNLLKWYQGNGVSRCQGIFNFQTSYCISKIWWILLRYF